MDRSVARMLLRIRRHGGSQQQPSQSSHDALMLEHFVQPAIPGQGKRS
jgi:hypothetical protein